jgi:broad specificity phosphatase PhoE
MRVILVRHGQTELNARGIYRGRIDVPLSPRGVEESEAIARTLRRIASQGIFSSPLARACETARAIAAHRPEMNVEKVDEFSDMDFGEWQGRTIEEVREWDPGGYQTWVERPERAAIPGGENLESVRERALRGMQRLVTRHPDGTVIIVSHGAVIKVLLCAFLGLTTAGFWKVKQDTGAINVSEFWGDNAKVLLMNDTCHLLSLADSYAGTSVTHQERMGP